MCPSYLDGDHAPGRAERAVIPVTLEKLCSFQGPPPTAPPRAQARGAGRTAERSLKTQQHASCTPEGVRPAFRLGRRARTWPLIAPRCAARRRFRRSNPGDFPRKEVIQPHLPVRLPCYDFTPVTSPTFDGSLPQGVRPPASGVACFRGVTGGVYKARERIHRGDADPRLLATPPSWRRVSASNPNRDAL